MRTDLALYRRDCNHCWQHQYYEDGEHKGEVVEWRGKPMKRPPGSLPPCMMPMGCKKGTIDNQNTLTETNAQIIEHYRECRAIQDFPDDEIVRQNAGIIFEVERMIDRAENARLNAVIEGVAIRGML